MMEITRGREAQHHKRNNRDDNYSFYVLIEYIREDFQFKLIWLTQIA